MVGEGRYPTGCANGHPGGGRRDNRAVAAPGPPRAPALFGFQGADGMVSTTSASAEAVIADDDFGVVSITRQTPSNELTSADSLTWRVTFSMPVSNVDATDFTVTGRHRHDDGDGGLGRHRRLGRDGVGWEPGRLQRPGDAGLRQQPEHPERRPHGAQRHHTPRGRTTTSTTWDNNPRAPDAPGSLTAAPGNGRVSLSWTAAAENNNPILLYEYRSKGRAAARSEAGPSSPTATTTVCSIPVSPSPA